MKDLIKLIDIKKIQRIKKWGKPTIDAFPISNTHGGGAGPNDLSYSPDTGTSPA